MLAPAVSGAGHLVAPIPLIKTGSANNKGMAMSTFLWILFSVLYVTALIVLGLATLRKGHYVLFFVGIFFPLLWIFGALMGPTPRAAEAA